MRRVFYDFEFLEDGDTIAPLSLAMINDQGATYQAVFHDAPWDQVAQDPWLMEHVVPHLPVHVTRGVGLGGMPHTHPTLTPDTTDPRTKPGWVIANEVRAFITRGHPSQGGVELWGDHPHYDHVALCQLWGRMVDLPEGVPMRTHCVAQLADWLGVTVPDQDDGQHDAMADAHHIRNVWHYLWDFNTEPA